MVKVKLGAKIIGSFALVAVVTLVAVFLSFYGNRSLGQVSQEIVAEQGKAHGRLSEVREALLKSRETVDQLFQEKVQDPKELASRITALKERDQKLRDKCRELPALFGGGDDLTQKVDRYVTQKERILSYLVEGKVEEAQDLFRSEGVPLWWEAEKGLEEATARWLNSLDRRLKEAQQGAGRMIGISWILAASSVFLAVALGFFLTYSITRPIAKVVQGIREGTDQVIRVSEMVASASQSLADGSSQQASGLQETSASLEEMSAMTRQNADNAQQARTMMGEVSQIIGNVSSHMTQMAKSIGEITRSSEETGHIIKTIDEIAFQTNLLALNAAVEAARAGEAGAGFAVVADEVRSLAMRAAEAAKNTSTLIENTIKSIKSGHELTLATQEAFKKNVEVSEKVSQLIEEIAAASQEQAQGISLVSKAVNEMDQVTQKNTASAQESASAAAEIHHQAERLTAFVGELAQLLDGRGPGNGLSLPFHKGGPTAPLKKPVLMVGKPAGGKDRSVSPLPRGKEIKPSEVIPLDEGFKEF